jgi:hypothetical protein
MDEAEQLCDRLVIMGSRIVAEERPRARGRTRRRSGGAALLQDADQETPWRTCGARAAGQPLPTASSCAPTTVTAPAAIAGDGVPRLGAGAAGSLEDVFLILTGRTLEDWATWQRPRCASWARDAGLRGWAAVFSLPAPVLFLGDGPRLGGLVDENPGRSKG